MLAMAEPPRVSPNSDGWLIERVCGVIQNAKFKMQKGV
jgi:hypothetical protein